MRDQQGGPWVCCAGGGYRPPISRRACLTAFLRFLRDSRCPNESSAALAIATCWLSGMTWDSLTLAGRVTWSVRGRTHVASPRCIRVITTSLVLPCVIALCHGSRPVCALLDKQSLRK